MSDPGGPQGLFLLDTRYVSHFELWIDGEAPEPLSVSVQDPYSAIFVARGRHRPGRADAHLLIVRRRYIGQGGVSPPVAL